MTTSNALKATKTGTPHGFVAVCLRTGETRQSQGDPTRAKYVVAWFGTPCVPERISILARDFPGFESLPVPPSTPAKWKGDSLYSLSPLQSY